MEYNKSEGRAMLVQAVFLEVIALFAVNRPLTSFLSFILAVSRTDGKTFKLGEKNEVAVQENSG